MMAERKPAQSQEQVSTDFFRVTKWHFAPGTETGWHRHGFDYLVVPVVGGILTVEDADGSRSYPIETGVSYARKAGVAHNIANDSEKEVVFVEVEFLDSDK